jgi:4-oxalocrotonate tautomerase
MPVLKLKTAPLLDPRDYPTLAAALTHLTARTLGKQAEVTAVLIEDLPAAAWHVGGRPVQRPTALLEIDITAGTNTAEQKAAFVAAAFDELQRRLGTSVGFEPASYIVVRELPATDWGHGGHTQQVRRGRRAAAPGARSNANGATTVK